MFRYIRNVNLLQSSYSGGFSLIFCLSAISQGHPIRLKPALQRSRNVSTFAIRPLFISRPRVAHSQFSKNPNRSIMIQVNESFAILSLQGSKQIMLCEYDHVPSFFLRRRILRDLLLRRSEKPPPKEAQGNQSHHHRKGIPDSCVDRHRRVGIHFQNSGKTSPNKNTPAFFILDDSFE